MSQGSAQFYAHQTTPVDTFAKPRYDRHPHSHPPPNRQSCRPHLPRKVCPSHAPLQLCHWNPKWNTPYHQRNATTSGKKYLFPPINRHPTFPAAVFFDLTNQFNSVSLPVLALPQWSSCQYGHLPSARTSTRWSSFPVRALGKCLYQYWHGYSLPKLVNSIYKKENTSEFEYGY